MSKEGPPCQAQRRAVAWSPKPKLAAAARETLPEGIGRSGRSLASKAASKTSFITIPPAYVKRLTQTAHKALSGETTTPKLARQASPVRVSDGAVKRAGGRVRVARVFSTGHRVDLRRDDRVLRQVKDADLTLSRREDDAREPLKVRLVLSARSGGHDELYAPLKAQLKERTCCEVTVAAEALQL